MSLIENPLVVEKTSKIKKNKKKKKKRELVSQADLKHERDSSEGSCACCQNKMDTVPTVDDEEESDDDPSYTHSIFQSIVEELLEEFYDEIDNIIDKIMKDSETQRPRTFMRLMRKLGEKFEEFGI